MAIQKRIKSAKVRELLGGISPSTLFRMWKHRGILPAPQVVNGVNYWFESDVDEVFKQKTAESGNDHGRS
ncbi:MAG: hypothetical protein HQL91_10055 [Magnetococcales bacterium]|nr:hypothetical protein [Magnetococcales bacterium]